MNGLSVLTGGAAAGPMGDPTWGLPGADPGTLFDYGTAGFYCSAQGAAVPVSITYSFPKPAVVAAHSMTSAFVGCVPQCDTPTDFDFEGTVDGVSWVRLDEVRGAVWPAAQGETSGRQLPHGPAPPEHTAPGFAAVRWLLHRSAGRPDGTHTIAVGRLQVFGSYVEADASPSTGPPTPLAGALQRSSSFQSNGPADCPICFESLDACTYYGNRLLPCGDRFHVQCIEAWGQRGNAECPVCKAREIT
eukprot:TRINITY_DN4798_c3_g1_i1.p1 TRINITY_DN4798_c3_g1~~TRINITY_DN4798_c3_g1_i1.p1  ORF type:complete len:246 (+),score=69.27 TRINITY_DN4798_c3_g1_i1:77-814(+)